MTWRERTAVAILLLVARIVCNEYATDFRTLATNIAMHGKDAGTPRENGAAT